MKPPRVPADRAIALELVDAFSLEMTGRDLPGLLEAKDAIPTGTKVNITFLGSEDFDTRVAAAQVVRDNGFVPVPHIAARRLRSLAELEEFLGRLKEVGASEHVVVVGGDPAEPEGPFADSLSVIETGLLEKYGVREVSIAGYPGGHPDIPSEELWRHLEEKLATLEERGLDAVILTQFVFDADPVVAWIEATRGRGVGTPIRIGVPGPVSIRRLLGFARRFGIGANAMIVKKYGFSLTNLVGTAGPDRFVSDLAGQLAHDRLPGEVELHFYTFGGLLATAEWVKRYVASQS